MKKQSISCIIDDTIKKIEKFDEQMAADIKLKIKDEEKTLEMYDDIKKKYLKLILEHR